MKTSERVVRTRWSLRFGSISNVMPGMLPAPLCLFSPVVKTWKPTSVRSSTRSPAKSISLPYAIFSVPSLTVRFSEPLPTGGVSGPERSVEIGEPIVLRLTMPQLPA